MALVSPGLPSSQNSASAPAGAEKPAYAASKSAAASCTSKLKILEESAKKEPVRKKAIRFSEDEMNSYLALDLSSKYHPSLKSLVVRFEEDQLQGVAVIDFDLLGMTSTSILPKLISFVLSGKHTLTVRGQLVAKNGKGHFKLKQALFDNNTLPRSLVEKIITAVGRKQKPPFDPLTPSEMPYKIDRVDVHPGYIIVHQ